MAPILTAVGRFSPPSRQERQAKGKNNRCKACDGVASAIWAPGQLGQVGDPSEGVSRDLQVQVTTAFR